MFKSEYAANVAGFICANKQARKAPAKQSGFSVFHVIGFILLAVVVVGVIF